MLTSNHAILLLFLSFLMPETYSTTTSLSETFTHCLTKNSIESHPISPIIYTPEHSSFSNVLKAYIRNLRFNEPTTLKPLFILTPSHVTHVQAAVICGKQHNLLMKIRSGGHDYEGVSYVSTVPFFLLDMFNLRSINVSLEDETAWVQAGATLGEVYYRIAEKSKTHGFPAGVCPTVGVGGHFSGSGYGNMMRKYGTSVDNIIDAELVDSNGRFLNRETMGEDLFWAISGGGGASFGVVISYKIKLVHVPEKVTVFKVMRSLEEGALNIVYRWQEIADKLPKEIFIRMRIDVVEKKIRASFITLFLGDAESLLVLLDEKYPELGLRRSDCIEMTWAESVLFFEDLPNGTPVEALLSRTPQAIHHLKRKSDYLQQPIPKEGLEFIFKKMVELETPWLYFNPYGGKMSEISEFEKPFPHRAGNICKIQYLTNWKEGGAEAAEHYINLTRMLYDYMTPFVSKNPRQSFLCYRDLDIGTNKHGKNSYLEGSKYGVMYFKSNNFDRLVKIKTLVDPDNFFRNEQSVPVAPLPRIEDDWSAHLLQFNNGYICDTPTSQIV